MIEVNTSAQELLLLIKKYNAKNSFPLVIHVFVAPGERLWMSQDLQAEVTSSSTPGPRHPLCRAKGGNHFSPVTS